MDGSASQEPSWRDGFGVGVDKSCWIGRRSVSRLAISQLFAMSSRIPTYSFSGVCGRLIHTYIVCTHHTSGAFRPG